MRIVSIGSLLAASLLVSGCATVIRGSSQKFSIVTTPTQADVKLSTGQTCVSPCELRLKRKKGFIVTANKPGYKEATAVVDARVRGGGVAGGAANILGGGLIGIAVDASSGAMNDLTPNPLHLELKPIGVTEAPIVESAPAEVAAIPAIDAVPSAEALSKEAFAADAAPTTAPAPGSE